MALISACDDLMLKYESVALFRGAGLLQRAFVLFVNSFFFLIFRKHYEKANSLSLNLKSGGQ